MSFEEALERGKELASALNYIHCECTTGVSIIHRDLKPDNIGIDCDGTLKVIDFGLSICVKRRTNNTSAYKMTGRTGTMRYMCPEVALGQKYSEKVDVYSFAIILWQMVADSIPYKKITKDIFFDAVARGGERPPLNSHWPEAFCELLESCWAESQETRPSFNIVMKVLDEIIAEEESESKRDYSRK
jgi:serine/threonine protein kinase